MINRSILAELLHAALETQIFVGNCSFLSARMRPASRDCLRVMWIQRYVLHNLLTMRGLSDAIDLILVPPAVPGFTFPNTVEYVPVASSLARASLRYPSSSSGAPFPGIVAVLPTPRSLPVPALPRIAGYDYSPGTALHHTAALFRDYPSFPVPSFYCGVGQWTGH